MLGDTAVAVNPEDERHGTLRDRKIILPVIGREMPVIADDFVDPEFGSGIVKVTPAHDPNDFDMGRRHDLEEVVVIGDDGVMTDEAGKYAGMDRFACRKAIIDDLEKEGIFLKVEPHHHAVGHCIRCQTMIEPIASKQWFVNAGPVAEPAMR